MQPATVGQEPISPYCFVSQLGYDYSAVSSHGQSTFLSNNVFFDAKFSKPNNKVVASLSVSSKGAAFSIWKALNQFNRDIRFHCERLPLGFASVRVDSGENNGFVSDGNGVLEEVEGVSASAIVRDAPKKVLILMSDTGGGHRASAEAIKAAFNEVYGDHYQVVQYES